MPEATFARLHPDQKLKNTTLAKSPGRKHFTVAQGFVPVTPETAQYLATIHEDAETTARGGKGRKAFEIVSQREAVEIAANEQRMAVLEHAGSGLIHAELDAIDRRAAASRAIASAESETAPQAQAPVEPTAKPGARSVRAGRKSPN